MIHEVGLAEIETAGTLRTGGREDSARQSLQHNIETRRRALRSEGDFAGHEASLVHAEVAGPPTCSTAAGGRIVACRMACIFHHWFT